MSQTAETDLSSQSGSTDVGPTTPTTSGDSTSTSMSEADTTTGEPLVCLTPTDPGTAGEPALWTYSHGIPSEVVSPTQVTVALDGSVTTALAFNGEIDLGQGAVETFGGRYSFFTRYSADGKLIWSSHIATPTDDSGYDSELHGLVMAVDCAGSIIVGGGFTGKLEIQGKTLEAVPGEVFSGDLIYATDDIFLVKFGPDGARRWSRRFGDDREQRVHGLGVQANGTIIIGGASNGTLELDGSSEKTLEGDPASSEMYVGLLAAFDPDGVLVWKRSYHSTDDVALLDLAIAPDDRIFAFGHAGGDTDFGGAPVVLVDDPDFIAQFEADGTHGWSARFFDKQHQTENIAADAAGGVVFSGSFGVNAFVARYDKTGEMAWNHDLLREAPTDTGSFSIGPLIVDGEILVGGGLRGSVDFGGGALVTPPDQKRPFLAQYDLTGAHLSSTTYEAASLARFITGDRGPDGELAFVGDFKYTLDLGDGPVSAIGDLDLFIHHIKP